MPASVARGGKRARDERANGRRRRRANQWPRCSRGLVLVLVFACEVACEFPSRAERYACESTADCVNGRTCEHGFCVVSVDAGIDGSVVDASTDAQPVDADIAQVLAMACPPAGYTFASGPNGYYRMVAAGATWANAQAACAADVPGSSHLVVLSTSAEVSYVAGQIASAQVGWIGLSDRAVEGVFVTITGETGDQRPWAAGEPNNSGGEDCAVVKSNGQLDDRPCGYAYRYVCECDGRMSML